jgi:hypothetical protein
VPVPERLHGLPAKVPLLSDVNVTVPVGAVVPDEETVAVHELAWLTATEDGVHATPVVVVWTAGVTVSENWPLLVL